MCEALTLGTAAVGAAGLLGTGMQVAGQMQAGDAARKQAEYQAAVARNNQIAAGYQADDAARRGDIAEETQRRKVQQILGAQKAGMAASGFQIGDGTNLDILGDTAAMGELDALTIRSNAQREAWGYRAQGANFGADAGLLDARGRAAEQAGWTGAGATLLTGLGQAGDRWMTYRSGASRRWGY